MSLINTGPVRRTSCINFGGGLYLSIRSSAHPAHLPRTLASTSQHPQPMHHQPAPPAPHPRPGLPLHPTKSPILPATNPSPPRSDQGNEDNIIPPPITPPRLAAISCEPNQLTPPLSNQRKNVTDRFPPSHVDIRDLRRFLPRQIPDKIDDLTPDLLQKISQSLSLNPYIPHIIPCPLNKFQVWEQQNIEALKDLRGLWEYDAGNAIFIITCMPTPVHESLSGFIHSTVIEAIKNHTGRLSGVEVYTNSEVRTTNRFTHSKRIPDIMTKARLHPLQDFKFRRSIIFEVGLTQTLHALRDRARIWLHETEEEVHLVVLIKLLEVPPAKYTTMAGETISRSRARKNQFEWQTSKLLFEGRTLEQEIHQRISGCNPESQTSPQQILFDIKNSIREYLLQMDRENMLFPPLVEPIDSTIYVYRRTEYNAEVSSVLNPLEEVGSVEGELDTWRDTGGTGDAAPQRVVEGQELEGVENLGADWQEQTLAEEDATEKEPRGWGFASTLESGSESQLEEEIDGETESEQSSDAISEEGDERGLDLVWSVQFMHNGSFSPNLPPESQSLTFTIAELYGPLPLEHSAEIIPAALLRTMPPALHAHALENITFPLIDFAERIQESRCELALDRAFARADKIVDIAYTRWYEDMQAEETRALAQRRRTREMELREARRLGRKRKAESTAGEDEVDVDQVERRYTSAARDIRF
ncbi:hypothetical protein L211DRAFT_837800 [Terfezia boudieri ATCC MYA-4762]|uniref:Uncharacterized protein n=1 Tax=Terfezia boudieri ATCC MYA-4762 TaxID=1051890 RepID=A0A3N4LRS6_9PEZI|nr:hypothetical protein L211DRAFT_837800 [Terfezia boudieri ATCC MYA-4762]